MLKQFDIERFRSELWPDLSALGFEYHHALAADSLVSSYSLIPISKEQRNSLILCLATLMAARDRGHVCLPLSALENLLQERYDVILENKIRLNQLVKDNNFSIESLVDVLLISRLATLEDQLGIDPETAFSPLIIRRENLENWLYLRADQISESTLANALATRDPSLNSTPNNPDLIHSVSIWIDQLPAKKALDPGQKAAVIKALTSQLLLLTGGPGTGKTTTVFHILRAVFHRFYAENQSSPLIALCSPTGRAAARMNESLQKSRHELEAFLQNPIDRNFVAVLEGSSGMTMHRMLNISGSFQRQKPSTVLPFDIIIVDEASMVDLHMMGLLISRLAPHTQLILVGDQNQLPSVESGAILAELCGSNSEDTKLATANLTTVFRSSTEILDCAQAILSGNSQKTISLASSNSDNLRLVTLKASAHRENQRNVIINEWVHQQNLLKVCLECSTVSDSHRDDVLAGLYEQANRSILLSPQHKGLFGTVGLNERINEILRNELRSKALPNGRWFPGMMVMVAQNDYERGLYNGDRGLVYRSEGQLRVYFPGGNSKKAIHPGPMTIPGLEPAYALTIHKSQGSEFQSIYLFLAAATSHEGHISRELLYTGITRAKTGLTLVIDSQALELACATKVARWSRLGSRLQAISS